MTSKEELKALFGENEQIAMMVMFRTFTETDWHGWAGAEPWENGALPLIAEFDEDSTVIVDARGVSVTFLEDVGIDDLVRRAYMVHGTTLAESMHLIMEIGLPFTEERVAAVFGVEPLEV